MTELPDRLLRDALHATASAEPSPACADADALAAWADGAMIGAERAAFEHHAAGCAHCQALMAAMVQSEPPAIEPAWWRRQFFSWVMPLAAATAAIVIVSFVVIGRPAPAPQLARNEAAPAAPPRAEGTRTFKAPAPSGSAQPAPPASGSANRESRRDRAATIARAVPPQAVPQDAAASPAAKAESRAQDMQQAAAPRPVPALPAAAAVPVAPAAPATAEKTLVAPAPAPAPPAAAAGGAAANAGLAGSTRAGARDEARTMMRMAGAGPRLIASPARESQWRIVDGAVEHTEDGGATWQAQALGVDVPVRAGAAPAARVCWLAGVRGLVLLTTDGVRWRRVAFPATVDLVAIEATDAAHATVTAATGRRFSTSDGGETWVPQ